MRRPCHRMETAIDLGVHSGAFTYEETLDSRNYSDDCHWGQQKNPDYVFGNDIFFKLTLTRSLNLYAWEFDYPWCIFIRLLDASGNEVDYINLSDADFSIALLPGTYYIIAETARSGLNNPVSEGTFTLYISGEERASGEDFYYPLDLGTFGKEFTVSHRDDLSRYESDYEPGVGPWDDYHDMVCRFTLLHPVQLTLENSLEGAHTLLKRWEDDVVEPVRTISDNLLYYELEAGTYYIHTWASGWGYLWQTLSLTGTPPLAGGSFSSSIDIVGEYYGTSFWYDNTFNTSTFVGSKMSAKAGNEVYYRFTFTEPMGLDISNCGSEVDDTYLMVYSSNKELLYFNDRTEGRGACDNVEHAYLQIPYLLPGTYYIVVDGSTNGNINLIINGWLSGPVGDKFDTAIDAGTYDGGFLFTDTRDTSAGYTDDTGHSAYPGTPGNDVFYKFTLTSPMDLKVSHCGSVLTDTYLNILDADGALLYSNDNYTGEDQCGSPGNALIKVNDLPAGTYYIISEGNSENGFITLNIEALGANGSFSPTMGQPHVISYIPTIATDDVLSLGTDEVRHEIQYYDYYGNPTVKVDHGFSPFGNDLFTLQDYDGLGRASDLWLPMTKGNTDGSYVEPASLRRAAQSFSLYGKDSHPYSRSVYDGSALNELVEQYGPGMDWHTAGRSVKTDRMTNLDMGM